ncbi:CAP domain-containing protein [Coemansia spiralis]|nr:CAP domain-containing protein [Coemansia spiralis]
MKFACAFAFVSLLGALAGAQPVDGVDRRNIVVETVYATVIPQAARDQPVVVVTVTDTVAGQAAAPTAAAQAIVTVVETVGAQIPIVQEAQPISSAPAVSPTAAAQAAATTVIESANVPAPAAHAAQPATSAHASSAVVFAQPASRAVSSTQSSSTAAPATTSSSSSPSSSSWMSTMLSELNAIRAAVGKPALTLDSTLSKIAQKHSDYQASVNTMTHSDPSGTLGARFSADGVSWEGAAENIAWNQADVSAVMKAWKNSPGHYENMIGDYTSVGFGVTNLYWTQDFLKA